MDSRFDAFLLIAWYWRAVIAGSSSGLTLNRSKTGGPKGATYSGDSGFFAWCLAGGASGGTGFSTGATGGTGLSAGTTGGTGLTTGATGGTGFSTDGATGGTGLSTGATGGTGF